MHLPVEMDGPGRSLRDQPGQRLGQTERQSGLSVPPTRDRGVVRFAYADPPYPGQAKRWYGDHPDYAGEVDHAELIKRLCGEYPDGWALSTSSVALSAVLRLCPDDAWVAVWHVTNRNLRGDYRWMRCWEPVIIHGGRRELEPGAAPLVRDVLAAGKTGNFTGSKPPVFCRWVFALLGALPGDELDDLFPGSGVVGREWQQYHAQPWIEPTNSDTLKRNVPQRIRQIARTHAPLFTEGRDEGDSEHG